MSGNRNCHHAFTAVAAICAKERSGVHAVEEAVKSVIGSVYEKFHLVPDELVRIANRNPDRSGAAVHRPTPPPKTTAFGIAGAVYAECELAAKELYERYEGKAEQCAVAAWQRGSGCSLGCRRRHIGRRSTTRKLRQRRRKVVGFRHWLLRRR
ncbi:hypothetical protein JHK87_019111 [Glycine soja]|nr:hypothetical protein JHK87_019111 [Glycine soja]